MRIKWAERSQICAGNCKQRRDLNIFLILIWGLYFDIRENSFMSRVLRLRLTLTTSLSKGEFMTICFAPLELGSNLVFADKKVQRYRTYFFHVLLDLHCELYANNGAVRALLCKLNFDWLIIEIASQMAWNSLFWSRGYLKLIPNSTIDVQ